MIFLNVFVVVVVVGGCLTARVRSGFKWSPRYVKATSMGKNAKLFSRFSK